MLYLVPTPIGNLNDMTFRAIEVLKSVDLILAEDTRVTKKLCQHFEISTRLDSFHSHNEHKKLDFIIDLLNSEKDIALVSDAGTPGISDPGFLLVREAVKNDIPLSCLPGATAIIPAIVMSGLPCEKFFFEGFLPQKKGRMTRIKYLVSLDHTFILYESPYRVVKTLKQILELSGEDRKASVSREISKMYEETVRGSLSELIELFEKRTQLKGEFVICVEAKSDD